MMNFLRCQRRMEEKLHNLKFTKEEEANNPSLVIGKMTMRYKRNLPGPKKASHILRLEKVHYADILADKERSCQQTEKR